MSKIKLKGVEWRNYGSGSKAVISRLFELFIIEQKNKSFTWRMDIENERAKGTAPTIEQAKQAAEQAALDAILEVVEVVE